MLWNLFMDELLVEMDMKGIKLWQMVLLFWTKVNSATSFGIKFRTLYEWTEEESLNISISKLIHKKKEVR